MLLITFVFLLYLSAEIIYRHNGSVWIEIEIGQGSNFHFNFFVELKSDE